MYKENSKDMYGDGKVTLDCVISVKRFDQKSVKLSYNKYQEKKIRPTDPTLHRACEGKQTIIFFALVCCLVSV